MKEVSFNRAEINLGTLCNNYKRITEYAGSTPVLCVVKADAYGHGAIECARALYGCGCRFFAVANAQEALEIRATVGKSDILILGIACFDLIPVLCENSVICTLASYEQAKIIKSKLPSGKKLRVHIKIDTGMNRIGFSCDGEGLENIKKSLSLGCFEVCGLYSHLAVADEPGEGDKYTDMQFGKYKKMSEELENCKIDIPVHHISNSAATFLRPDLRLDTVRCGIILYGIDPSEKAKTSGLEPVMTLRTKIVHLHTINAGDSVGYGATYTAKGKQRIATLPIGYDDGFIRAYSKTPGVIINGKTAPIVGRICMDQCMVNVTDIECKLGDDVELFGKNNSVNLFAKAANTIPYESVCIVSKRVPRVYIGG
ncbi:MAG: alanine racemase [Clostridia bacterium]|nr:alanine racemase [Clostridia bacterium]